MPTDALNTFCTAALRAAVREGFTGELVVGSEGSAITVSLMAGSILAAEAPNDMPAILGRMAREGHLYGKYARELLVAWERGDYILDRLTRELSAPFLDHVLHERFRENLRVFLGQDRQPKRIPRAAVFPENLQMGHVDLQLLLECAEDWNAATALPLNLEVLPGSVPADHELDARLVQLADESALIGDLLPHTYMEPIAGRAHLAFLLREGVLRSTVAVDDIPLEPDEPLNESIVSDIAASVRAEDEATRPFPSNGVGDDLPTEELTPLRARTPEYPAYSPEPETEIVEAPPYTARSSAPRTEPELIPTPDLVEPPDLDLDVDLEPLDLEIDPLELNLEPLDVELPDAPEAEPDVVEPNAGVDDLDAMDEVVDEVEPDVDVVDRVEPDEVEPVDGLDDDEPDDDDDEPDDAVVDEPEAEVADAIDNVVDDDEPEGVVDEPDGDEPDDTPIEPELTEPAGVTPAGVDLVPAPDLDDGPVFIESEAAPQGTHVTEDPDAGWLEDWGDDDEPAPVAESEPKPASILPEVLPEEPPTPVEPPRREGGPGNLTSLTAWLSHSEDLDEDLEAFADYDDHRGGPQDGRFTTEEHNLDRVEFLHEEPEPPPLELDEAPGRAFGAPPLTDAEAIEKVGVANDVLRVFAEVCDRSRGAGGGQSALQLLVDGAPSKFSDLYRDVPVSSVGEIAQRLLLRNLHARPMTEHRRALNEALADLLERTLSLAADEFEDNDFDDMYERVAGYRQRLGR